MYHGKEIICEYCNDGTAQTSWSDSDSDDKRACLAAPRLPCDSQPSNSIFPTSRQHVYVSRTRLSYSPIGGRDQDYSSVPPRLTCSPAGSAVGDEVNVPFNIMDDSNVERIFHHNFCQYIGAMDGRGCPPACRGHTRHLCNRFLARLRQNGTHDAPLSCPERTRPLQGMFMLPT